MTDDSIVAYSVKQGAQLWSNVARSTTHSTKPKDRLQWYRPPAIADLDRDDTLEVINMTMDNNGDDTVTGALTLDVNRSHNGWRSARNSFPDERCWGHFFAVGDFVNDADTGLEVVAVAGSSPTDPGGLIDSLYLFDGISAGQLVKRDVKPLFPTQGRIAMSNPAVGNLYGSSNVLEVVIATGVIGTSTPSNPDSLLVFSIDRSTGTFGATHASYPIRFSSWTIVGSTPALGDIDTNGTDDIAFATDDTVYLLKMTAQDTLSLMRKIPFGAVPANRLGQNQYTPQALLADIQKDSTDTSRGVLEVIVNHQADGKIWAFNALTGKLCDRFPLRTKGRVEKACQVTDLDGNGKLDLVAVDEAGFMYAWEMDSGSVYRQPWPSAYGNNWNTACRDYRPNGEVGYLYEDWAAPRVQPYEWLETEPGNSLTRSTSTTFSRDSGWVQTDSAGNRNYHFRGAAVRDWTDYTIQGSFRFANSSAEFGINFCSEWPRNDSKYSIIRKPDGTAHLLYYSDASTWQALDTMSLSVFNDTLDDVNVWYNYRISVSASDSVISAWFWKRGDTKPDYPGISVKDYSLLKGTIGLVSAAGTGERQWGPMTVTSNTPAPGAYMADEQFVLDTMVDVKPCTPHNWKPDYGVTRLRADTLANGFYLDTSSTADTLALLYKHRPGVPYPVACFVAPETNLEWKNYTFSGKLVMPANAIYDDARVSLLMYGTSKDTAYEVLVHDDTLKLSGFGYSSVQSTMSRMFKSGDSLYFNVEAENIQKPGAGGGMVADSLIRLSVKVYVNDTGYAGEAIGASDNTGAARLKHGYPGLKIDLSRIPNYEQQATLPVRLQMCKVQKQGGNP